MVRMSAARMLILGSLLLLAACASAEEDTEVQAIPGRGFAPRPDGWTVLVYVSPELPQAKALVSGMGSGQVGFGPAHALKIGVFDVKAEGYGIGPPLDRAKAKARSIGGDAVVITEFVSLVDPEDRDPGGAGPRKAWRLTGRVLRVYP